jgi:hypothetical protein
VVGAEVLGVGAGGVLCDDVLGLGLGDVLGLGLGGTLVADGVMVAGGGKLDADVYAGADLDVGAAVVARMERCERPCPSAARIFTRRRTWPCRSARRYRE